MGTLYYCDWCQDEISYNAKYIEYFTKYDAGFHTREKICDNCRDAHLTFIKAIKQKRKPYIGYKK